MNVRLKVAMLEKKVKGFDLAKHLNCDPGKVSKIVNGWIEPNHDIKLRISRLLEMPVEELFGNSKAHGER